VEIAYVLGMHSVYSPAFHETVQYKTTICS